MSERVQVLIRLRPLNETEKKEGPDPCVAPISEVALETVGASCRQHTYDRVFSPSASQEDLYNFVGDATVKNVLKGYNGTLLAYGQTGSGKTHSMLGPQGGTVDALSTTSKYYNERGVIPRVAESLFDAVSKLDPEETTWKIHLSVLELYCEMVQDLLTEAPKNHSEYRIREEVGGRGIYVENLFAKPCLTASELLEGIKIGVNRRKVASTRSNETSSRSHSVTMISLEQTNHMSGGTKTLSRLTLVDLAGSEKVGKTMAEGQRLKEAQTINLSLTLLGNVINKLTDGKSAYIPYRDSKLTRLLQDSFGGNSRTLLLCHASPAQYNRDETVSTLLFAARAKQIKNKPRVNRELGISELQLALDKMREENNSLKDRLSFLEDMNTRNAHGLSPMKRKVTEDEPPSDGSDLDDLQAKIQRLMDELADANAQLYAAREELSVGKQQVEFHKSRADAAHAENQALKEQAERDHAIMTQQQEALEALTAKLQQQQQQQTASTPPAQAIIPEAPTVQPVNPRPSTGGTSDMMSADPGNKKRAMETGNNSAKRTSGRNAKPTGKRTVSDSKLEKEKAIAPGEAQKMPELGVDGVGCVSAPPMAFPGGLPPATPVDLDNQSEQDVRGGKPKNVRPVSGGIRRNSLKDVQGSSMLIQRTKTDELHLQLELTQLRDEIERLKKSLHDSQEKESAATSLNKVLQDELETAGQLRDDLLKKIDELNARLEKVETENGQMRDILEKLGIDLEEQLAILAGERGKNTRLTAEADRLKGLTTELQKQQQQQEYCEMASVEFLVKGEDMDSVEQELAIVAMGRTTVAPELFEGTRNSLLITLRQLREFADSVSAHLDGNRFLTSNLEGQRLNLLTTCAELQSRISRASKMLGEH